ncbi:MAG: protein translocase subunit SecD [Lysobacterales bacterium]|jgi:preprotein translocase subunit SecD|nr:MAG: protein translocase subunit SecD [Xanthomonadales bacterium]
MVDYPRWKYLLIAVVMLIAAVYALPNLFPQEPAVQISGGRGATADDALLERARFALEKAGLEYRLAVREGEKILIRFPDVERQMQAADLLRRELGQGYTVALNLASTVPGWLAAIGGKPLVLGLDLQGGVHFLMEVDQRAVIEQLENRFAEDIRVLLRENRVRYRSVVRAPQGIAATLLSEADRERARGLIEDRIQELSVEPGVTAEGSFQLLAKVKPERVREAVDHAVEQNLATLRNRINELGVAEPIIQRQGANRIVVQLPGVQDTASAKRILGATATLEYRAVDMGVNALEAAQTGRVPPDSRLYYGRDGTPYVLKRQVIVSGDQLIDASAGFSQDDGTPAVFVRLNSAGARRMLDFTQDNVGNLMAVVFIERIPEVRIDENGNEVRTTRVVEEVISAATIRGVFGASFQTTGLRSPQEAAELALLLRAGSLAAPVDIVEERTVGPSLGQDNIERGINAILLGFALVLGFMLFYYRMFGLIANIALLANVVLIFAALSILGATLTMPGIAGVVLTVGMAVDANVLIFERIREELRAGNTPLAAIKGGYDKAWSTIADANVTTLIAGLALFAFGSGPIRGFAVVLCIGILTSMFTAVTLSQAIVSLAYGRRRKLATLPI